MSSGSTSVDNSGIIAHQFMTGNRISGPFAEQGHNFLLAVSQPDNFGATGARLMTT